MNRPSSHTWTRLHVPSPLTVTDARAALTALATVPGSPLVVLEASGTAGKVSWRLGCDQRQVSRITSALRAHLPELRTEPEASTFDGLVDVAAAVRVRVTADCHSRRTRPNRRFAACWPSWLAPIATRASTSNLFSVRGGVRANMPALLLRLVIAAASRQRRVSIGSAAKFA
ncbi:MAG: hypothetical protein ACRCYU_24095 [Nocardioides sp.]